MHQWLEWLDLDDLNDLNDIQLTWSNQSLSKLSNGEQEQCHCEEEFVLVPHSSNNIMVYFYISFKWIKLNLIKFNLILLINKLIRFVIINFMVKVILNLFDNRKFHSHCLDTKWLKSCKELAGEKLKEKITFKLLFISYLNYIFTVECC